MMKFNDILHKEVGLCGVDNNAFCVSVDGKRVAFEAVEDESDGYRSMLDEMKGVPLKGHVFFRTPVAQVVVEPLLNEGSFEGYVVKDVRDGHVWLRFGTDRADDYYPMFTFEYVPPHVCSCRVCGRELV